MPMWNPWRGCKKCREAGSGVMNLCAERVTMRCALFCKFIEVDNEEIPNYIGRKTAFCHRKRFGAELAEGFRILKNKPGIM